jgi:integrase
MLTDIKLKVLKPGDRVYIVTDSRGLYVEVFPTGHDMRRTASTLLHETGFVSDVIEKALNHTMGGVRGVCDRAEYAGQRRDMLQWWADYVDSLVLDSRVVHFKRAG